MIKMDKEKEEPHFFVEDDIIARKNAEFINKANNGVKDGLD